MLLGDFHNPTAILGVCVSCSTRGLFMASTLTRSSAKTAAPAHQTTCSCRSAGLVVVFNQGCARHCNKLMPSTALSAMPERASTAKWLFCRSLCVSNTTNKQTAQFLFDQSESRIAACVPALALPRTPLDRLQPEPGTRPPNVRV